MNSVRRFTAIPGAILTLTLGRLLLVPLIIASLGVAPVATFFALAAFVALDLYDGVAARRIATDDVPRRVLDSAVDRLSIWLVYAAAGLEGLLPLSLLLLFGARDIYCGLWCYRLVHERDVAIKADWLYRSLNLALAFWIVVAPLIGGSLRVGIFSAICAYALLVAVDLQRSIRIVLGMPSEVRARVIAASALRRMRIANDDSTQFPLLAIESVRSS